jgi:predicted HTH transcriptional regulator
MDTRLKELIKIGENSQIEFKKKITHLEKIAKTLVSFANSSGGTLLIGVEDNGSIVGANPEEEKYMLEKAAQFYCRPQVLLSIEEVSAEEDEEITVLLVKIKESNKKPHFALQKNGEWVAYVREHDKSLIASPLVLKALEMQSIQADQFTNKVYTNNEKRLFDYLQKNRKINLRTYAKLINVSKKRAHKILLDLTLKGLLYSFTFEKDNFYTQVRRV